MAASPSVVVVPEQTDDVIEMESLLFRRTNRMKLRGLAESSTDVSGVVQAWRCSMAGMQRGGDANSS